MARMSLTVFSIVLISVLAGCSEFDQGRGTILSDNTRTVLATQPIIQVTSTEEVDLVEKMLTYRQSYRQSLEMLISSYHQSGNELKLQWAINELTALDRIPQYSYIVEASIAGPELRATTSNRDADEVYLYAYEMEKKASELVVIKDDNRLREVLEKYNQVIRNWPDSDKIDDAAFRAAGLYFYFKDYSIAALYYQRAYQWNAQTPYPARYKTAFCLDTYLSRRDEALPLYQQALAMEKLDENQREWAQTRVASMTRGER